MKTTRTLTLLLAALMAAGTFASCGGNGGTDVQTQAKNDNVSEAVEETAAEPDPFADFDFGGAEIRMLVSANDYDGRGSSIYEIVRAHV